MEERYHNGILGWLFDAFILQVFLVGPLTHLTRGGNDVLYGSVLAFSLVIWILSILYHARWKYKTTWRSPGEHFIVVEMIDGKKIQTSPFRVHRFFLYLILVIDLFTTPFIYDQPVYGQFSFWRILLLGWLYDLLIFFGAIWAARGKWLGLLLISIALIGAIIGYGWYMVIDISDPIGEGARIRHVVYLVLNLAILPIFFFNRRPTSVPQ